MSQSAVSRAFTPGSSIAADKRGKIIEAARKLNYVPNSIASSLTTKRTNIVAVIVGDMANPFYVQVLRAFSQRLQEQGRQVLTFTVAPGMDTDDIMMRVLQYQVDGVIVTSAKLSTRMTGISHDRGIPIVLFNRYIPGSDASCVRCDNAGGGRIIAETFLAAGARSFAMITGDPHATTSKDRVRGFVEHLVDHGVQRSAIEQAPGFATYEGGADACAQLFGQRGPTALPDALFCISDIMAMGAMDFLRLERGLRIPGDMMVAGFDDIPESQRLSYRLTTVRQPLDAMVDETLAMLQLDEPLHAIEPGIDRVIAGSLIWRDTVPGSPPGTA